MTTDRTDFNQFPERYRLVMAGLPFEVYPTDLMVPSEEDTYRHRVVNGLDALDLDNVTVSEEFVDTIMTMHGFDFALTVFRLYLHDMAENVDQERWADSRVVIYPVDEDKGFSSGGTIH